LNSKKKGEREAAREERGWENCGRKGECERGGVGSRKWKREREGRRRSKEATGMKDGGRGKGEKRETGKEGKKRQWKHMIVGGTGAEECTYLQSPSVECQQHCCHLHTQKK